MFVLITYDVNTEDADGKRRLRRIAKQCVNYGQRVQNSVFECILDPAQCRRLKAELCSIMDAERRLSRSASMMLNVTVFVSIIWVTNMKTRLSISEQSRVTTLRVC